MSDNSIVKVGIIGLGGISNWHIKTYRSNPKAKIIAICDNNEKHLEYYKKELNIEYAYKDYKDLLANSEVDSVDVCLPNFLHKEITIVALEAGKHVLCQKPMALNAVEAEAMHQAAVKAGKKLMITQFLRTTPESRLLKKQVENGFFGDIYFIRTGFRRPIGMMPEPVSKGIDGSVYSRQWFNERDKGGGVLRDLGAHLIDLSLYLTGFPKFTEVIGSCYRKFFPDSYTILSDYKCDSEDLATGFIKFDNGMSLQIEVSFGSYIEEEVSFIEIYGTQGGASSRNGVMKFFKSIDGGATVDLVKHNSFERLEPMDIFVDAILEDIDPLVTSEQGVEVIRLLDALYESAGPIK